MAMYVMDAVIYAVICGDVCGDICGDGCGDGCGDIYECIRPVAGDVYGPWLALQTDGTIWRHGGRYRLMGGTIDNTTTQLTMQQRWTEIDIRGWTITGEFLWLRWIL
jgi:hypothetical protein